jgi:hypothetical protein
MHRAIQKLGRNQTKVPTLASPIDLENSEHSKENATLLASNLSGNLNGPGPDYYIDVRAGNMISGDATSINSRRPIELDGSNSHRHVDIASNSLRSGEEEETIKNSINRKGKQPAELEANLGEAPSDDEDIPVAHEIVPEFLTTTLDPHWIDVEMLG